MTVMDYEKLELLIGGEWTNGTASTTIDVLNPATEQVLSALPLAGASDLDQAIQASEVGFRKWRAIVPLKRQEVLERAARLLEERHDFIAVNLTREMGKPLAEAKAELDFSISVLRWYGEEGKRAYGREVAPRISRMRQTVQKVPIGPVAAFAAWNFPALNVMRKIAGALAAGCSIGFCRKLSWGGQSLGNYSVSALLDGRK